MIAAWMLFAVASGTALTAAAAAADRLAAVGRVPLRLVWVAALVATAVWPAAAALGPRSPGSGPIETPTARAAFRFPTVEVPTTIDVSPRALDAALLTVWGAASAVLVIRLAVASAAVRRWRRTWPAANVDGVRVRVAPDVGPAVVGLRPTEVVLPRWALALDAAERALVLRHEAEHRTARDPYLLAFAAVLTALAPWHPALWYQARRLRLAVELDCDARVLRADPRPAPYARLLVAIARRRGTRVARLAPALYSPAASHLERRVAAMHPPGAPLPRTATLALGTALATAAVAAVAAACAVEAPVAASAGDRGAAARATSPLRGFVEFRIDEPATLLGRPQVGYPDALRDRPIAGEVLARVVVDTTGRADPRTLHVLRATHPAFAAAVAAALPAWRFRPARVGRHAVRQLVDLPVQFASPR